MAAPLQAAGLMRAAVARPSEGLESRIEGTSMAPTIPDGALIRVVPVPPEGCRPGMVVACLSERGTLFAHRVVRCVQRHGEEWLLTLGDGWKLCDPPVPAARVVGTVGAWRVEGDWTAPAPPPPRRGVTRVLAVASIALVAFGLRLHPQVARRTAGTGLQLGAWLKTLRRRWRRWAA
jgi:hypothetical protein